MTTTEPLTQLNDGKATKTVVQSGVYRASFCGAHIWLTAKHFHSSLEWLCQKWLALGCYFPQSRYHVPIPTAALPFVTIIKVIFLSSVHKSYLKLMSELPALSLAGALLWPRNCCLLRKFSILWLEPTNVITAIPLWARTMWNEWKWISMLWAVNVIALGLNVFNDVGGCLTDFLLLLFKVTCITSAAVVKGHLIQSPLKSGHSTAIMFLYIG